MSNSSWIPIPAPLRKLYSKFPLYYYPATPTPQAPADLNHVLWITPPSGFTHSNVLSSDVECLKWQAYIALRGINNVRVRWDIVPAGGVDGRLPCLWVPSGDHGKDNGSGPQASKGELLSARMIPGWADEIHGEHAWNSELEGYIDEQTKDESRAWVSLLEGAVHAALISSQPPESLFSSWLYSTPSQSIQLSAILTPPPLPLTGLSTLLPAHGTNIPVASLRLKYHEAITAISERLGTDKWFLGSSEPTPLDALLFAYLHTALHPRSKGQEHARAEVTRRVNLVAWERKVHSLVQGAFRPLHPQLPHL